MLTSAESYHLIHRPFNNHAFGHLTVYIINIIISLFHDWLPIHTIDFQKYNGWILRLIWKYYKNKDDGHGTAETILSNTRNSSKIINNHSYFTNS